MRGWAGSAGWIAVLATGVGCTALLGLSDKHFGSGGGGASGTATASSAGGAGGASTSSAGTTASASSTVGAGGSTASASSTASTGGTTASSSSTGAGGTGACGAGETCVPSSSGGFIGPVILQDATLVCPSGWTALNLTLRELNGPNNPDCVCGCVDPGMPVCSGSSLGLYTDAQCTPPANSFGPSSLACAMCGNHPAGLYGKLTSVITGLPPTCGVPTADKQPTTLTTKLVTLCAPASKGPACVPAGVCAPTPGPADTVCVFQQGMVPCPALFGTTIVISGSTFTDMSTCSVTGCQSCTDVSPANCFVSGFVGSGMLCTIQLDDTQCTQITSSFDHYFFDAIPNAPSCMPHGTPTAIKNITADDPYTVCCP